MSIPHSESFPHSADDFAGAGGLADDAQQAIEINVQADDSVAGLLPPDTPALLAQVAAAVLAHELVAEAALTILLTDDDVVQQYNRDYRGVDAPTDVLSFAAHDGESELLDLPDGLRAALERELGDLLIAVPYAQHQAMRFGNSLRAELMLLTAHGVLHLLGYDHATPDEERALWQLQEAILAPLGVTGLSLRPHDESHDDA